MPAPSILTFLFTQLEASGREWDRDATGVAGAMARHESIVRATVDRHGGRVFKVVGGHVHAVFESASSGITAALEIQQDLGRPAGASSSGEIRLSTALASGSAELRDDDYFGPTLHRAARILEIANPGHVVVAAATAELATDHLPPGARLTDLGAHRLRDLQRPEELYSVEVAELSEERPPLRSHDPRRSNLPPQLTSFVGRERERTELVRAISERRLVTLTGPGGSGKTRLALAVAGELQDRFPDGVWLVDLAPVTDPSMVTRTVAAAAGIPEEPGQARIDVLVGHLEHLAPLLILDSAERLVDAVGALASALLQATPGVRILVTSREALEVGGEVQIPVPPLALPPAGERSPERLARTESIRLFVERARTVAPGFVLDAQAAPLVAQIVTRLDGSPLAIELAATRTKALSLQTISDRLDDRFRLLASGSRGGLPRHRTLRATIDWSWDLLGPADRMLLRRLSVFAGGFTIEQVGAICTGEGLPEGDPADLLGRLVHRSLVVRDEWTDGTRFRLLETIRDYSQDRLAEAAEDRRVRARHAAWFLAFAEESDGLLRTDDGTDGVRRLELEHDNLRSALDWYAAQDGDDELRLATALVPFWRAAGHLGEGDARLAAALERRGAAADPAQVAGLAAAGLLATFRTEYALADARIARSLALGRRIDDRDGTASALHALGVLRLEEGDLLRAAQAADESLRIRSGSGRSWRLAETQDLVAGIRSAAAAGDLVDSV